MSQCNKNKTKKKHKEYAQNLGKGNFIVIENSIKVIYSNLSTAALCRL